MIRANLKLFVFTSKNEITWRINNMSSSFVCSSRFVARQPIGHSSHYIDSGADNFSTMCSTRCRRRQYWLRPRPRANVSTFHNDHIISVLFWIECALSSTIEHLTVQSYWDESITLIKQGCTTAKYLISVNLFFVVDWSILYNCRRWYKMLKIMNRN